MQTQRACDCIDGSVIARAVCDIAYHTVYVKAYLNAYAYASACAYGYAECEIRISLTARQSSREV